MKWISRWLKPGETPDIEALKNQLQSEGFNVYQMREASCVKRNEETPWIKLDLDWSVVVAWAHDISTVCVN